MTIHVFGMILTHEGTFSNNRGENEGTTNTLQKIIRNGEQYTTVSAEAIRYALRDGWQQSGETLNRQTLSHRAVDYQDREFGDWPARLDDDVLGFMHAKNETVSRRAPLEISRALSITPYLGDVMHNFASTGSNPSSTSKNPHPYSAEIHHTRYQFGFALTPDSLGREGNDQESVHDPQEKLRRVEVSLRGLSNLRRVGGAHARYFADYSPEVLILRVTTDPAPRMLYCFEQEEGASEISICSLERKLGEDIEASELIIGAATDVAELQGLTRDDSGRVTTEGPWEGATLTDSVKDAVARSIKRLADLQQ